MRSLASKSSKYGTFLLLIILLGGGGFGFWQWFNSLSLFPPPHPSLPLLTPLAPTLQISKLKIKAPIILDVPGTEEKAYLKALEGGVAQYQGTAHPGEKGNSFIIGHSEYYKNKPGDYKEIFKKLNELQIGDSFSISKEGQILNYKVFRSEIVADDDFSVLNLPERKEEIVTLMTCWPPGTLEKRYIVQAERVL